MVAIILSRYSDDNSYVPPMLEGRAKMNDDLPMMLQTFMVKEFQGKMMRMKTIKVSVISNEGNRKQLPDGFAVIVRDPVPPSPAVGSRLTKDEL